MCNVGFSLISVFFLCGHKFHLKFAIMSAAPDQRDIRRQAIPVIYVRGTHYEIGFDVVGSFYEVLDE